MIIYNGKELDINCSISDATEFFDFAAKAVKRTFPDFETYDKNKADVVISAICTGIIDSVNLNVIEIATSDLNRKALIDRVGFIGCGLGWAINDKVAINVDKVIEVFKALMLYRVGWIRNTNLLGNELINDLGIMRLPISNTDNNANVFTIAYKDLTKVL